MSEWKLVKRERLAGNLYRDKYVLDPSVTITGKDVEHAWYGTRSNADTEYGNPEFADIEFTDTEKQTIDSDDGNRVSHSASATQQYKYAEVAHKFLFDTYSVLPTNVILKSITYGWDGYASGYIRKIMRFTRGGWEDTGVSAPTSDGSGVEFEETLTNLDWVLIGGKFKFGVYVSDAYIDSSISVSLHTDYIFLTVTYETSNLIQTPVINPRVIGVSGYER